MKKLFFALAAGGMIASCQPKPIAVPGPMVEYKQSKIRNTEHKTQNSKHETVRGTWKDGECWIEGNDMVVYKLRNEAEPQKFKTKEPFLEKREIIREIKCGEEKTYALTDQYLIILVGAAQVFLGKGEFGLDYGRIEIGDVANKKIDWLPREKEAFFLTRTSLEFLAFDGRQDRRIRGDFDQETRMTFYNGVLLIAGPNKKSFLMSYVPGDERAPTYDLSAAPKGRVSFTEEKDYLKIKIGETEIKIIVKKGKVDVSIIKFGTAF